MSSGVVTSTGGRALPRDWKPSQFNAWSKLSMPYEHRLEARICLSIPSTTYGQLNIYDVYNCKRYGNCQTIVQL